MQQLQQQFDALQPIYGDPSLNSVFGGGQTSNPAFALVFMNTTARNVAAHKTWQGERLQWLGTKDVWKFLAKAGLFSQTLCDQIETLSPSDWTPKFSQTVYEEVKRNNLYITNLAKCTQSDARPLSNHVFLKYRSLFLREMELVNPKQIVLFGNQVASIAVGQPVQVGKVRKTQFNLQVAPNKTIPAWVTNYPVGIGRFHAPKAVEDLIFLQNK